MTVTDIKLSTDADGTEHWERFYVPDDLATIRKFLDLDTGHYVNYGAFYEDGSPLTIQVEQTINVLNQRARVIGLAYFTPLDFLTAFPDGANLVDRTFNYTLQRGTLPGAPETIFANLTRDLLDSATVTTHPEGTDHASINHLIDDPDLGTTYFDPPALDFSDLAAGDEVSYALAVSDDLWTALAGQSEWAAIRFAFFAQSGTVSDVDDAVAVFWTLNDDGLTHTSVMPTFRWTFTIPGTTIVIPPPAPKFHNARQVLDAHRRPSILIGRRRFGRRFGFN